MNRNNHTIVFHAPVPLNQRKEHALPVGNGYMGASLFGGISKEKCILSVSKLQPNVSGIKNERISSGSSPFIEEMQAYLLNRESPKIPDMIKELNAKAACCFENQLLFNTYFTFSNIDESKVTEYTRKLLLDTGMHETSFVYEGALHKRICFMNYPSNVFVLRFSSDKWGRICVRLHLESGQEGEMITQDGALSVKGLFSDNETRYAGEFRLQSTGGVILYSRDSIIVEHAYDVTIFFSAATDYSEVHSAYRSDEELLDSVTQTLDKAEAMGYNALVQEHIDDFTALNTKTDLRLPEEEYNVYNTEGLLPDITAEELCFYYERYLTASFLRK